LNKMTAEEKVEKVKIIDCDLEGSTGLNAIRAAAPEIFFNGGIQERGNFEACAGFGSEPGKQGIFSTFAAFQEMVISELTMARLNYCNVLSHFSHSGSDDMADNTCHFGINNYFADNGIQEIDEHHPTLLFFPTDAHQMEACVEKVFPMDGLRFIYSTRSATPYIQDEAGNNMFEGKPFELGKDNVIREGKDGYVVTYGDATYRALDAVERLRKAGHDVGLISKPCLNVVDEETMKLIGGTKFCLVVEPMSEKTGLGMRFGTWLLQRGYTPKYANIGVTKEGPGGLWEHAYHQGYDAVSIYNKLADMINNL
jgi:transketolase C-terminal domain/subunit